MVVFILYRQWHDEIEMIGAYSVAEDAIDKGMLLAAVDPLGSGDARLGHEQGAGEWYCDRPHSPQGWIIQQLEVDSLLGRQ